ncbi:alpha/beta fold hydrolase [Parasedimentitalea psychrophila]|uniref:Alpha/beta fold hydrolase n=1 Tax=Parasedimentitalea psychrophila TaxID=2997337 RepID=A0A9Y2L0Z0_9RHOB|nr:alpha/beta fold hydrolase [Parasedimentitalea psychrophila]WIY25387.1 alpha/beta fold hydrolase [Parasedimentitalea psychrophila]
MEQAEQLSQDPLVLLPGMMCDARVFAPQIRALSGQLPVMVAPLLGGERIEDIALRLLPQLPQRFALAGLSMGGIVAMEILRRAPERVSRLCLMSTSPLADTPAQAASREPLIIGARTGRMQDVLRQSMRPEYLAPGPQRIEILNQLHQMGMELGEALFVSQTRALQRRRDQQGTLRKCKVPTLILCGEYDPLTPVKRHEFLAELIPNAALEIVTAAGHLPTLERPDVVNRVLVDWLAESVP